MYKLLFSQQGLTVFDFETMLKNEILTKSKRFKILPFVK